MKLKKLSAVLLSLAMVCTTISSVFAEKNPTDPKLGIKAEVTGFYDGDTSLPIIDLTVDCAALAPVVTSGMSVKSVVGVSALEVRLQLSDKFSTEGVNDDFWAGAPEGTRLLSGQSDNVVYVSWANAAAKKFITNADQKISFVIPQTGTYTIDELNADMGKVLAGATGSFINLVEYADKAEKYSTIIGSSSDCDYPLASAVIGTAAPSNPEVTPDEGTIEAGETADAKTWAVAVDGGLVAAGDKLIATLTNSNFTGEDATQVVELTVDGVDGGADWAFNLKVRFKDVAQRAATTLAIAKAN